MKLRIKEKIQQARLSHSLYACVKCNHKTVECVNKLAQKLSDERYVRKCFNQSCELYGQSQMLSAAPSNIIMKVSKETKDRLLENKLNRQLKYSPAKTKSIAHVTDSERNELYNEIAELFNN